MGAKIELKEHDDVETLRREIRKAKDGRYQLRLRCILMRKEGAQSVQIQKELNISRQSIARWIKAYNEGGKEALATIKSGNKEGGWKWDAKIFDALVEEIRNNPGYWSVPRMRQWIRRHYGVDIPRETVRWYLKKRGFSYKSARPSPYLGEEEAKEDFKKRG